MSFFFLFQQSTSPNGWSIILGRQNQQGSNPNEVSTTVDEIVLHPAYDRSTQDNDIALLRLSSPVNFTDYIFPVCLASSDSVFHQGTESWVTGWGNTNEGGEDTLIIHCRRCWDDVLCETVSPVATSAHCFLLLLGLKWTI